MARSDESSGDRKIRVLIVADVRLDRDGLAASLGGRQRLLVVGTTANRTDAMARSQALTIV
jgi:hypothetical protein